MSVILVLALYNYVCCKLLFYIYVIFLLAIYNHIGCHLIFYIYKNLIIAKCYYIDCWAYILYVCHFGWHCICLQKISYGP